MLKIMLIILFVSSQTAPGLEGKSELDLPFPNNYLLRKCRISFLTQTHTHTYIYLSMTYCYHPCSLCIPCCFPQWKGTGAPGCAPKLISSIMQMRIVALRAVIFSWRWFMFELWAKQQTQNLNTCSTSWMLTSSTKAKISNLETFTWKHPCIH